MSDEHDWDSRMAYSSLGIVRTEHQIPDTTEIVPPCWVKLPTKTLYIEPRITKAFPKGVLVFVWGRKK